MDSRERQNNRQRERQAGRPTDREREIRRQRKLRKQRYLQRKRRRRIILFFLFLILTAVVVGGVFLVKGMIAARERGITVDPEKIPDITMQSSQAEGDSSEEEPVSKMISLTEADIYTGDLILVNAEYEYHFEENADSLNLISLDTYKDGAIPVSKDGMQLAARIMEPLYNMIEACNTALDVDDTGITSAYRTKEYQQSVFEQYEDEYGLEKAEEYVSDPGHSEHHTGLSLDMGIYYEDGGEGTFSGSSNAKWIDENCHKYGFIRRYKEDKTEVTGISNESWHFRYVGIPHATYMNENNLCLEEYIEYLRENTSLEEPLTVSCSDGTYRIYATKETTFAEPENTYTISGDNIDGYIITEKISQTALPDAEVSEEADVKETDSEESDTKETGTKGSDAKESDTKESDTKESDTTEEETEDD